jgi:hypothetical protein
MLDPARRIRPPGGVRFAGWMIGINAFFLCMGGVLLLFVRPETSALEDAGLSQGILQLIGFVMLAIGLVEFLLIYALWDGSNVARIVITVLVGLSVLGSLGQALGRGFGAFLGVIQLVIDIAILIGLWGTPAATEFFGRPDVGPAVAPGPPPTPPPPV